MLLAGMTFLLAILTVFQETIRARYYRPRLTLKAEAKRPAAEKNQWDIGLTDVYYFRVEINNEGNIEARDVQVYLADLKHKNAANKYTRVERFSPMRIMWAHYHTRTLDVLLPGMPWFCDFFHVADPAKKIITQEDCPQAGAEPVLALDLEVPDKAVVRFLPKGEYLATLKVGASNHLPVDFKVKVTFKGLWFPDESQMFRDGVALEVR
jgi:hypothetical protein